MTRFTVSLLSAALAAAAVLFLPATAAHAAPVALDLTTGPANKLDLGFFAEGTAITLSFSGSGDVVGANFQTLADGSLAAPATSPYEFANNGAAYPALFGGDGVNHYAGGGAAFDFTSGQFMYAGLESTDTTNPATIRAGAVIATFVGVPTRTDWLFVGTGTTLFAPAGGANLYLAVNDVTSGNSDNHGTYSGEVTTSVAVPEAGSLALALPALGMVGAVVIAKRRRK